MDHTQELMKQNDVLKDSKKYLSYLENLLTKDPDNETLKGNVDKVKNNIQKIEKNISVLNSIDKLENDYSNHNPITFHYVDNDGTSDDIELTNNDVNYTRAYWQQRSLLELEYNYINKKPFNYSGNLISSDSNDYDNVYNTKKDKILHKKADINPKKHDINEKTSQKRFGATRFTPNLLDSEYVIFKKNGYLNIVGNFTKEWIKDNFYNLEGDLVKDKDIKRIKIWNNLKYGTTPLNGLDVKVKLSKEDGKLEIIGDVDQIEYHHCLENSKEFKEPKHLKQPEKDFSGLDIIPDDSLTQKTEPTKESKKPIKRRHPKPSLLKRAKEKFSNLKTWQKVAIVAGVIAVAGVGIVVIGPHIMEGINNLINPEHVNTASNLVHSTDVVSTVNDPAATSAAASLDYSNIGGAGQEVYTNAYDAVNNANSVVSNQWFGNNPVDVFNTATNSYMGLTPEQLNDPNLMAQLAQDPNNAVLFGNSISDASGFMPLDEAIETITKIR